MMVAPAIPGGELSAEAHHLLRVRSGTEAQLLHIRAEESFGQLRDGDGPRNQIGADEQLAGRDPNFHGLDRQRRERSQTGVDRVGADGATWRVNAKPLNGPGQGSDGLGDPTNLRIAGLPFDLVYGVIQRVIQHAIQRII
jgi:hypothetical protein